MSKKEKKKHEKNQTSHSSSKSHADSFRATWMTFCGGDAMSYCQIMTVILTTEERGKKDDMSQTWHLN